MLFKQRSRRICILRERMKFDLLKCLVSIFCQYVPTYELENVYLHQEFQETILRGTRVDNRSGTI